MLCSAGPGPHRHKPSCVQDIPESEETARLAVVDLDWDHVSAEDILAVLRSFLQWAQAIQRVSVYPSDYGLQVCQASQVRQCQARSCGNAPSRAPGIPLPLLPGLGNFTST